MDVTEKKSFFLILPRKLIIISILLFFTSLSIHLIQVNSTSRLILAGNEMSHLALLYSIVHENSIEIKSFRGFDESYYKGKYYSNKPPGYSFFLTMPYWIFSRITNSKDINKTFIFTKLLNSFFSSLTFVMIYLFLSTFSKKQMLILLGLMAATLGTFFPAYNVLANSIPLSILLCIFALFFYRLFFLSNNSNAIYWSISLFCINYAVLTDYVNGFLLFPLFVFLILKTKKKFILPGIISIMPLIILVIYNYLVFDNPFAITYSHYLAPNYVQWEGINKSMSLGNIPNGLFGLLFSPSRGLLLLSPITLLGIISIFNFMKQRNSFFLIFPPMILSNIFIISAFNLWHGGHCVGYRYILIPGIILGMFSFFFWEKHNRIFKTVIIIILIISVFNGIMSFFIQKDQELFYKTWKSEPLDVHSNYYTELLYPFFIKKDK